jgi:hypothetical protein
LTTTNHEVFYDDHQNIQDQATHPIVTIKQSSTSKQYGSRKKKVRQKIVRPRYSNNPIDVYSVYFNRCKATQSIQATLAHVVSIICREHKGQRARPQVEALGKGLRRRNQQSSQRCSQRQRDTGSVFPKLDLPWPATYRPSSSRLQSNLKLRQESHRRHN